ncbi:DUF1364 domain-containing protein [Pseudoalteromonas sp. S554]|uniref:DUF1364 domain-containing protein n=1 Tax=Pseudoalteromonas sp. S554 TaxID=2066516 RepID=UPI00110CE687|nr:DUF1364 domain-containing protein [Pseudoalteromonas sp. S554]TMS82482.1 DUF1364 domain-containing protein [Pseudoalteromonas sp. S554]
MSLIKTPPIKSKKIRESAKGKDCQVRIPGVCNFNPETTVLAHVGRGSGVAQKCDDIHSAYACSDCHDVIDGRVREGNADEIIIYAYEGMVRTQKLLLEQELMQVAK